MATSPLPTAQQVATRLVILRTVSFASKLIPPPDVFGVFKLSRSEKGFQEIVELIQKQFENSLDLLRTSPFAEELSLKEQSYMATPVGQLTPRQMTDVSWRIESGQTLAWCLGMFESLAPYDAPPDLDALQLPAFRDPPKLLREARLRPMSEIEAARDKAKLWHWRSRTRELIESGAYPPDHPKFKDVEYDSLDGVVRIVARGLASEGHGWTIIDEDFAALGKAYRDLTADEWSEIRSVTIERHVALNWACGYAPNNRWEKTPTDT